MHPRFDWALGRYAEWVTVPAAPVVILEGCASGSARDPGAREPRRLGGGARGAPARSAGWSATGRRWRPSGVTWQAHEEAHFAADGTRAAADVVVDGVSGQIDR